MEQKSVHLRYLVIRRLGRGMQMENDQYAVSRRIIESRQEDLLVVSRLAWILLVRCGREVLPDDAGGGGAVRPDLETRARE